MKAIASKSALSALVCSGLLVPAAGPAPAHVASNQAAVRAVPVHSGYGDLRIRAADWPRRAAHAATVVDASARPPTFGGDPTAAARGRDYYFDLTYLTKGGRPPYSYAMGSGALPAGMRLSEGGGVSSIEVTWTTQQVVLEATDSAGETVAATLTFRVDGPR